MKNPHVDPKNMSSPPVIPPNQGINATPKTIYRIWLKHPYFLPKEVEKSKDVVYREKIINALSVKSMSLNELAKVLGYKSISKKLSDAVNAMLEEGVLTRVISEKGYSVITLA